MPPKRKGRRNRGSVHVDREKNTPSLNEGSPTVKSEESGDHPQALNQATIQRIERTFEIVAENQHLILSIFATVMPKAVEEPIELLQLPLNTVNDVCDAESWLLNEVNKQNLINHLASFNGRTEDDTARRIIRKLLGMSLKAKYNWGGGNGKRSLAQLQLRHVIISSVSKCHPDSQVKSIENAIKNWLQAAN